MMSEADAIAINLCVDKHGIRKSNGRHQPTVATPEWQHLSDTLKDVYARGYLLKSDRQLLIEMLPGVAQLLKDRLGLAGVGALRNYEAVTREDLIAEIRNFNRGVEPQEKPIMQYNAKQVSRATLEEFAQHHLEGGQYTFKFFDKLKSEAAVKTQAELDKELCDYLRTHLSPTCKDDCLPGHVAAHVRECINKSRNAPAKVVDAF